jgi:hypothetical protein
MALIPSNVLWRVVLSFSNIDLNRAPSTSEAMLLPFSRIMERIYPSFTDLKMNQKVTKRKTDEMLNINTTRPKMEDLNFRNPL